ncbi:MAG: hypothetical protein V1897_20325 [Pseudomonadota bacterium]
MKSSRRFGRMTNLLIFTLSCLVAISLAEISCYFLYEYKIHHDPEGRNLFYPQGYSQDDDLLGYKPKASTDHSSFLILNNTKIYDVIYSIDNYNRRRTAIAHQEKRLKFAIFFGCSYVYGEGVQNDQTLPYYFSEISPEYMPYNYGFHGYGPQEMLAKLQDDSIRKEINEKNGIAIYLYLHEHHPKRAIGNMIVSNGYGKNMPYYMIDSDNKLVRHGSFSSGRPVISRLYRLLGARYFVKYFYIQFPPIITDTHYKLTARMIEESRNEFKKKFMSNNFYVLIYPTKGAEKIIPYFEKAKITYFDYSTLFDPGSKQYAIPDGHPHPTPEAYRVIAEKLSKDILNSTN